MRVVAARVGVVGGALAGSVGHARSRWAERRGVMVVLFDEEHRVGLGEASPLPGYSSESLDDCGTAMERAIRQPLHIDDQHPKEAIRARVTAIALPPAARFALETALLDLAAQRRQVSIGSLLSGQTQKTPKLCGLIDADPDAWSDVARDLSMRPDVCGAKVKVGRPGHWPEELAALRELRSTVPVGWPIRIDVNGAWSVDEALRNLSELESLGIEFVEQPVSRGAWRQLGSCPVPWAADESLQDPREAECLLTSSCTAFVLKPAVLGGLLPCLELARRAEARGIASVASHLFDGPIALSACRALAEALPKSRFASGVDSHAALTAWPQVKIGPVIDEVERARIATWIP